MSFLASRILQFCSKDIISAGNFDLLATHELGGKLDGAKENEQERIKAQNDRLFQQLFLLAEKLSSNYY